MMQIKPKLRGFDIKEENRYNPINIRVMGALHRVTQGFKLL
jgi:hypothetical protein